MIQCSGCGKTFDKQEGRPLASISGSVMGDEYTKSYYYCKRCGVYTVEIWRERFCGEDEITVSGPVPKAEGDAQVQLIGECSQPWNKKCRCQAHRSCFGKWLD